MYRGKEVLKCVCLQDGGRGGVKISDIFFYVLNGKSPETSWVNHYSKIKS